ncbi:acyclic terpene utilization AtuA family protein [Dietzia kunjamensis]|uniref:acyclic terpene utilization AtuA family protein n=1 Tax=Dietzia kunjamensis TaxID=322509 RepID=UPI003137E1BC
MTENQKIIRIGSMSGFLGDRLSAGLELLESAEVDILTGDWLAELTMTILERQRRKDPSRGYATLFLTQLEQILGTCADRGIRVVSNAGGLNPPGAAEAVEKMAQRLGLSMTVGHVSGDDIADRVPQMVADGILLDADTGQPITSDGALVANAYLGGWPIVNCLERGADIVVTGRVTDAALIVGAAAWAHGWTQSDWDQIAGAVVAGHVVECGAQATGGNFSGFADITRIETAGFPIAEIRADGSSVITKGEGTGGAVTVDTVTAQLLYEIQGREYLNPDVVTDLRSIRLEQSGRDRVEISGTTGRAPTSSLKVSMAYPGAFRNAMTLVITGRDPEAKAELAERAVWSRIPGGRGAFADVDVSLLGRPVDDPQTFGESISMLRIAVAGDDEKLVGRGFSSAVVETALSSYPGFYTTTPPTPAVGYAVYQPALVPAELVSAYATVGGETVEMAPVGATSGVSTESGARHDDDNDDEGSSGVTGSPANDAGGPTVSVALGDLVHARSGDKGGNANVGLWAKNDAVHRWLKGHMTAERFAALVPGTNPDRVTRVPLPNLKALNFVITGHLGRGVSSSLAFDAQAKGLAEYVLARHVTVPADLAEKR